MAQSSSVIVEWVRQVPLFESCSQRELRAISGVVKEVSHPKGTTIAKEGDPGVGLFIIVDGEAEVTIGGKRMAILRRGDFFGARSRSGGTRAAPRRSDARLMSHAGPRAGAFPRPAPVDTGAVRARRAGRRVAAGAASRVPLSGRPAPPGV